MKTLEDLKKLTPIIAEQISMQDHEIGDYVVNYFTYEEDGWLVEVTYRCSGEWTCEAGDYWTPSSCELLSAFGEVTDLSVYHYDEETDEESEFSHEDCNELWNEISKVLEDLA